MKQQFFSAAFVLVVLAFSSTAHAITYYWDTDGATGGFGPGGGTWAAPTPGPTVGWSTSATGAAAIGSITTAADDLNFGTATVTLPTSTITVSGTQAARTLTFGAASGTVTLSGGTINLNTGSIAQITANQSATINSAISKSGAGYFHGIAGSGATLTFGGNIDATAASEFYLQGAGSIILNGSIGSNYNNFRLNSGTTTVTFTAANNFTGTVWLEAGGGAKTLNFSDVNQLGTGTGGNFIAVQGGSTLRYTGTGSQATGNRDLYWNSGAATVDITSATGNLTLNSTLANGVNRNQAFTKSGAGTLTLSAVNATAADVTGTMNISAGTMAFNAINANSATWSGAISGGGVILKTGTGAGALILTGGNSYTGATIVSQGTLQVSTNSGLTTTSGYTVNDANTGANDSTLRFAGFFTSNRAGLSGVGLRDISPITVAALGSGTTTIDVDSSSGDWINGTVTLNKAVTLKSTTGGGVRAGFLTFSGPGAGAGNDTVIYDATGSGNDANWNSFEPVGVYSIQPNTYSGNARFTGGVTTLQNKNYNNAAFVNLMIPDTASVKIDAGSTLRFAFGNESFDGLNDGVGGGGLMDTNSTATITVGASGGNGSFSGVIANGAAVMSLTKSGAGTQVLSGANTYTGNTTVNGGTLAVSGAGSLNDSATAGRTLTVDSGAAITYTSTTNNGLGHRLSTGTWSVAGAINMNTAAANSIPATITLTGGTLSSAQAGTTFGSYFMGSGGSVITATGNSFITGTGTGNFGLQAGGTLTLSPTGAGDTITASIIFGSSGHAAGGITKSGLGTATLSGANTYTGATTVSAGTLQLLAPGSLQNSVVNVNAGTFLHSGGTNNVTGGVGVGNLNIATGAAYTLNGGILDFQDTIGATGHHAGGTASQINLTGTAAFNFNTGTLQDISTINTAGLAGTFTQSGGRFFIGQDEPGLAGTANPANNPSLPDIYARTTTINGGFSLLSGGTVHFDAFGPDATPTLFNDIEPIDLLRVTGAANLNGIVDFDDEYGAEFGDVHTLVLAPTITLGPNFAMVGGFFRVIPTGPTGPGSALQAIVPEPASIAVWTMIGLAGVVFAWHSRSRRRPACAALALRRSM